jgi:predicted small lipoprotein YifL
MKRFLQWLALTLLVLSATSCGIPGLLGRTASNTMTQVKQVAGAAAAAAY